MLYTLVIVLHNGTSLGFGPYPEYPITELEIGPDGTVTKFVYKQPDRAAGEAGPTLAYVKLDEIDSIGVKTELPPVAGKARRSK